MDIQNFVDRYYHCFNSRELKQAAQGLVEHYKKGGRLFVTLAGAMSTARMGIILAEMINRDLVHGVSATGANLEEDMYLLYDREKYVYLNKPQDITTEQDHKYYEDGYARITDVLVPITTFDSLNSELDLVWQEAAKNNQRLYPYEAFFKLLEKPKFLDRCTGSSEESWVKAAKDKNIPIFCPGYEDSTSGNYMAAMNYKRPNQDLDVLKSGVAEMGRLVNWYQDSHPKAPMGFFQMGGGIAGDFSISVVPLINEDVKEERVPTWSYFCQISESTTSFGSYSGAPPSEKITWGKVQEDTPSFVIESDATIVAPLIFAYALEAMS